MPHANHKKKPFNGSLYPQSLLSVFQCTKKNYFKERSCQIPKLNTYVHTFARLFVCVIASVYETLSGTNGIGTQFR